MSKKWFFICLFLLFSVLAYAQSAASPILLPDLNISLGEQASEGQRLASTIQIVILMTVLTMLPSIIISLTSFTRITIVLSLLRRAIGTQQAPTNQVIVGLSLFLTFFVMHSTLTNIWDKALNPYIQDDISQTQALQVSEGYMKDFMFRYVGENELNLFVKVSKMAKPATPEDVPMHVLIPAFMISELKKAFQIGFLLFIPFLVIDIVVASILLAMGMMMLPPVTISFPFKLMLFVLVDGWYLVVGSLMNTF